MDTEAWAFFGVAATAIGGYLTSRLKSQADKRAADNDDLRDDFVVIVTELRKDVDSLRTRVKTMEAELHETKDSLRWATYDLRRILDYLRQKYGDGGPDLSPQVVKLMRGQDG